MLMKSSGKKYICSRNIRTMLNCASTHVAKAVQSGGMAFCAKRRLTPMDPMHLASASLAADRMLRHNSSTVHTLMDPGTVVAAGGATQCLKEQSTSLVAGGQALVGKVAGSGGSGEGTSGGGGAWSGMGALWHARPGLGVVFSVIAGVVGLGMYSDSKADKSEARMQAHLDKSEARMQATLKESEARMQVNLDKSEARMQAHLDQRLDKQENTIERLGKSTTKALDRVVEAIARLEIEQKIAAGLQRARNNERNGSADR